MTFLWQFDHPEIVKRRKELVKKAGLSTAAESKTWDELTVNQKQALMEEYHPAIALKNMTVDDLDEQMSDIAAKAPIDEIDAILKDLG
jgi:hypothetical protein